MYRRANYISGATISDVLAALRNQINSEATVYFCYNDGEMCIEGEIKSFTNISMKKELYKTWHLTCPIADIDRDYRYVDDLLADWVFAGKSFNQINTDYLDITWDDDWM